MMVISFISQSDLVYILSRVALPSYRSLQEPRNVTREDERGVHGGEYSVRPNMQESMVFLRKLFSHQKPEGTNASYSNLMSPPDSPLRTLRSAVWVPTFISINRFLTAFSRNW